MPENFTRQSLAAALRRVLADPSYRERARAFRAEIDTMPPMEGAIAKIEEFVAGRSV